MHTTTARCNNLEEFYWMDVVSTCSRLEYRFSKAINFVADLGECTPLVTISRFSSFLPYSVAYRQGPAAEWLLPELDRLSRSCSLAYGSKRTAVFGQLFRQARGSFIGALICCLVAVRLGRAVEQAEHVGDEEN